jgi:hypothetical protein
VNNELERMWKEVVMTLFEAMLAYLCGKTGKKLGETIICVPPDIRTGHLPNI